MADNSAAVPQQPVNFTLADFDFELPPELIAQVPAPERSASRLLDARGEPPADRIFRELPGLLAPGDLLVFNDTKVIKARLFGTKPSGGRVELLVERVLTAEGRHEVLAQLRASKPSRIGSRLVIAEAFEAEVLGREGVDGSLWRLRFPSDPFALLERHGHVPLPPYVTHADSEDDVRRYQTVFASRPGAVAAPTAALHFDEPLLAALDARRVRRASLTLHVGAGTFQPVRVEDLSQHRMHSEWFEIGEATVEAIERTRREGGRVVAVGTTSLRALESAAPASGRIEAGARETELFVLPGFEFRVVDLLVTNLHLPKSTLLMLVSAFAGVERIRTVYRHAIERRYRFFSYGDAMLLTRNALGVERP